MHRMPVRKGLAVNRMLPPTSQPATQAIKTTTPNTPPSQAPALAPYRAAPMMMGARARVMEKGPNLTKLATTCRTMMMAVNRASPVRRLVFSFVLMIDSLLLPLLFEDAAHVYLPTAMGR